MNISKRYNGSTGGGYPEYITTTIFDSMKKSMAWAQRALYLRLAAILGMTVENISA